MSYYTDYSLTVKNAPEQDAEAFAAYMEDNMPLGRYGDVYGAFDTWYAHEEDMRELSAQFPNALFALEGHGEEWDDHWIKYFQGGKMQYCPGEIVYPDFDESKLT